MTASQGPLESIQFHDFCFSSTWHISLRKMKVALLVSKSHFKK